MDLYIVIQMSVLKNKIKQKIIDKFMGRPKSDIQNYKPTISHLDTPLKPNPIIKSILTKEPIQQKTSYTYLEDDALSSEFGDDRDLNKTYNLYLCLYKINDDADKPFLEFFCEKTDNMYSFPKMEIQFKPTNIDQIEEVFNDTCSQFFQKITFQTDEIAKETYKGYLELDETNIFIFYNYTNIDTNVDKTTENNIESIDTTIWAIIDEIINVRRILDVPVHEFTHKLFEKHPFITYILDNNGHPIYVPCCLYLCEGSSSNYDNEYYEEDENRNTTQSLIDPQITHDLFGKIYLFSTIPFEFNNLSKLKRYAVFIEDTLYILNENFPLTKDILKKSKMNSINNNDKCETSDFIFQKTYKDYSCICFFENGVELWSIESNTLFVEL